MAAKPPDEKPHDRLAAVQGGNRWARWLSRAHESLDVIVKLMAPAAVLLAAWFGSHYQQSMQASQLLTQREQSDTQIRAEMFKAITEKLLGTHGKEPPPPSERAVFTELLALNFHEHIELRPLLVKVDKELQAEERRPRMTAVQKQAITEQRYELRSAARRVRDRQIAMLVKVGTHRPSAREKAVAWLSKLIPKAHAAQAEARADGSGLLRHIGVRFPAVPMAGGEEAARTECDVPSSHGENIFAGVPVIEISPDRRESIAITVVDAKWSNREFTVLVKAGGPRNAPPQPDRAPGLDDETSLKPAPYVDEGITFDINDFNLPLTDSTLLASGARYSVFVDKVCDEPHDGVKAIKLGVLWFPSDYYPARERPTNRRQIAESLGLTVQAH